ncbi:MAG: CRISPR-associated helicase Cas3', partial [Zestosphaera sp.]
RSLLRGGVARVVETISVDDRDYLRLAAVRVVRTDGGSVVKVVCDVKSKYFIPARLKEVTLNEYLGLITPDVGDGEVYVGGNAVTLIVASEGSYVRGRGLAVW